MLWPQTYVVSYQIQSNKVNKLKREAGPQLFVHESKYRLDVFHDHVRHCWFLFDNGKWVCRVWRGTGLDIFFVLVLWRWSRRRRVTDVCRWRWWRLTRRWCRLFGVSWQRQNFRCCFWSTLRRCRRRRTIFTTQTLLLRRHFAYSDKSQTESS